MTIGLVQGVVVAYMQCALWSSIDDESGEPLDGFYEVYDLADEAEASMIEDCEGFLAQLDELEIDWMQGWSAEQLGHDLWLTRNHHGAGFWDRYYGPKNADLADLGERLTTIAHAYGDSTLYVGDDGKLHVM